MSFIKLILRHESDLQHDCTTVFLESASLIGLLCIVFNLESFMAIS
jgi:hypothetical protein